MKLHFGPTIAAVAAVITLSGAGPGSAGSPSSSAADTGKATTTGTTVVVLDSVAGSYVPGATVTAVDSRGATVASATTDQSGSASLSGLAVGSTYTVTAAASGRAASAMQDWVATSGATLDLYCFKLGISGAEQTAPAIESIEYSTDYGSSYTTFASGATVPSSPYIRVTVRGKLAVMDTSWSGFGVNIDFDQMPMVATGYYARRSYTATATPVTDSAGASWYETVAVFKLSGMTFISGSHTLDVVSYDVANNRAEKRLPFTLD